MSARTRVYILMSLAAAVWGFQPLCVKWLLAEWTPVTITVCRYFLLGALVLLGAFLREGKSVLPSRGLWPWIFAMGFCGVFINNVFQFSGLRLTSVTNCTLISALTPALTALLSFVFVRERLERIAWAGILLSLMGTVAIITHGSLEVLFALSFNLGDLLCLGSQTAWGIYSLLGVRVMRQLSPMATTGWCGLLGSLLTLVYGIAFGEFAPNALALAPALSFGYILFLGGVFCMVTWNWSTPIVGASVACIFLNIMPLVGVISGVAILDEPFELAEAAGAVLILGGVFLTTHAREISEKLGARRMRKEIRC